MRNIIFYSIIEALILCIVFLSTIGIIYKNAEDVGYESLHIHTKEIKDNLYLQFVSDRENLETMANFAGRLYSSGESYDVLIKSFKSIGLIKDIGILTKEGILITRAGSSKVSGILDFEYESTNSPSVTGRVADLTFPDKEVIRSSVPVYSGGNIVAVLYGIIDLGELKNKYKSAADEKGTQLYVIKASTGNFIIDTWHEELGNISSLSEREYKNNFSFDKLYEDISFGINGFSAFESQVFDGTAYAHYSPIGIDDWFIMLIMPENIVFADAKETGHTLFIVFFIVILVMLSYMLLVFTSEKKISHLSMYASEIRRLLLTVNQKNDVIRDALEKISLFSKARSSFFIDTKGEEHLYLPSQSTLKTFTQEDKNYFILSLINNIKVSNKSKGISVNIYKITTDAELAESDPKLYTFLKDIGVNSIIYSAITDKDNEISILGIASPRKESDAIELLKDISVCFSMTVYNKKYIVETEEIAVTDALTGIFNRTAYKRYIPTIDASFPESLACIYIDVNELHIINNKYGHAMGDSMLVYIANVLKEQFGTTRLYRMGGDEFLIFVKNKNSDLISSMIENANRKIEEMNYHVSIGWSYTDKTTDVEELVKIAEKKMYEAKAEYYQYKEKRTVTEKEISSYDHINTGIKDLDFTLSIMSMHYQGIYSVSLDTDKARRILIPEYLKKYSESDEKFSTIFTHYVHTRVNPDYQRAMLSFLEYDVLKSQLSEDHTPSISYENTEGKKILLSIYKIPDQKNISDTLWIFENLV